MRRRHLRRELVRNAMARVAMQKGFDGGSDDGARNKYWIVPLPA